MCCFLLTLSGLPVMDAFLTQSWCLDLRNNEYQCPSRGICKDEGGMCCFNEARLKLWLLSRRMTRHDQLLIAVILELNYGLEVTAVHYFNKPNVASDRVCSGKAHAREQFPSLKVSSWFETHVKNLHIFVKVNTRVLSCVFKKGRLFHFLFGDDTSKVLWPHLWMQFSGR